jgi:hypothetical protein
MMTGEGVRQVFETIVVRDEIDRLCRQCWVLEQQRQLDLGMLVRAMVCWPTCPRRVWHGCGPVKPTMDDITRRQVTQECLPGANFDALPASDK